MTAGAKKFFRLLRSDFRRAVLSENFLTATLLVPFFYLLGTLESFAECVKYGMEISVYEMHAMAAFGTFRLLNYVLCAFPFAAGFAADFQSRYFRSVIARSGRRCYAISKVIVTALSGTLCLVVGELLYMLLCACFGTAVSAETLAELRTAGTGAFETIPHAKLLLDGNFVGYFLLLALTRGLVGSFLSLIALCVSLHMQNRFVILASPLLIFYFLETVLLNLFKLPAQCSLANIFDGRVSVIDSRYMFWYSLAVAVLLSAVLGVIAARGIERKLKNA